MSEWISVKDRLPEEKYDYESNEAMLFAIYNGKGVTVAWYVHVLERFGRDGGVFKNVTHWMPLPEPPECVKKKK